MFVPKILKNIAKIISQYNGTAVIVGGSVRDHFLKLRSKDYDVEVYGLESLEALEKILSEFGSVNQVGKSFGVLKFVHEKEEYDFSFPRLESKTGTGHRGFEVEVNGKMDFKTASRRRDFTVNAMGYDIEKKCFLDPFNGQRDIEERVLRHIDDDSFAEDSLRVYRAIQFSARFGFALADDTEKLCHAMVEQGMLEELPKERVYVEWKKLLLKAEKPSLGFALMRSLGVLKYFPELQALIDVPQDPKWHPEGDVWIHTMMSIDAISNLCRSECSHPDVQNPKQSILKLLFATLCHDLGKPLATTIEYENSEVLSWHDIKEKLMLVREHPDLRVQAIRSIGHERAGLKPTKTLMYRLTNEHHFIESILPLVEHHLKPSQFYAQGAKSAAIRRLATKVNIEELVLVAKADFIGRTTSEALEGEYKAGEWLLDKAKALNVESKPIDPLIQGRDLIDLGLEPSPGFKVILDEVYELQIEGKISTKADAIEYIKKYKNVQKQSV